MNKAEKKLTEIEKATIHLFLDLRSQVDYMQVRLIQMGYLDKDGEITQQTKRRL